MDDKQMPEKVRLLAVDTIVALASFHRIAERAPTIMHSWLRCVAIKSMQDKLMALLLILMNQVRSYISFVIMRYFRCGSSSWSIRKACNWLLADARSTTIFASPSANNCCASKAEHLTARRVAWRCRITVAFQTSTSLVAHREVRARTLP